MLCYFLLSYISLIYFYCFLFLLILYIEDYNHNKSNVCIYIVINVLTSIFFICFLINNNLISLRPFFALLAAPFIHSCKRKRTLSLTRYKVSGQLVAAFCSYIISYCLKKNIRLALI